MRVAALLLMTLPLFAVDTIFSGDTQVFAHVVDGATWQTTITLLNLGGNTATFSMNFYGDDGKPLVFATSLGNNNAFAATIPAHGSIVISTAGIKGTLSQGWALLKPGSDSIVSGSAVFRLRVFGQPDLEASVPGDASSWTRVFLPYDHVSAANGLAVVNQSSFSTISVTLSFRDDGGNQIALDTFSMAPLTHRAIVLTQTYPQTLGKRGTIEVSTGGFSMNVLGLRFNGIAFTSIVPVNTLQ